jgi:hypothetical protein
MLVSVQLVGSNLNAHAKPEELKLSKDTIVV